MRITSLVGGNNLDLLFNELSADGQFSDLGSFHAALDGVMAIRQAVKSQKSEIYVHTNIYSTSPIRGMDIQKAIGNLPSDKRRAVNQWITKSWWTSDQSSPTHLRNWYDGKDVTDSALGEAALGVRRCQDIRLVSLQTSDWEMSPLTVRLSNHHITPIEVVNYWECPTLEAELKRLQPPLCSWKELSTVSPQQFSGLTFSKDCFDKLESVPFNQSAAKRIIHLLTILNEYATSDNIVRQQIVKGYFKGGRAQFSDSSVSEKNEFRQQLRFKHPVNNTYLFCPWHGKINQSTLRIHFSWPNGEGRPIYVVYVGPKITKR
jgi:hypothetical protein